MARLGWQDRPDTFYMVGNTTAVQELAANAPNPADQVGWLLGHYVWPHPFRFAAVTLVMAWKSLWVRKYFSLVAAPFLAVLLWRVAAAAGRGAAGACCCRRCSCVLLHAATTVATPRYSLMLVPAYAIAFGLAAGPFLAAAPALVCAGRPVGRCGRDAAAHRGTADGVPRRAGAAPFAAVDGVEPGGGARAHAGDRGGERLRQVDAVAVGDAPGAAAGPRSPRDEVAFDGQDVLGLPAGRHARSARAGAWR